MYICTNMMIENVFSVFSVPLCFKILETQRHREHRGEYLFWENNFLTIALQPQFIIGMIGRINFIL
jgi:hypothetical protein